MMVIFNIKIWGVLIVHGLSSEQVGDNTDLQLSFPYFLLVNLLFMSYGESYDVYLFRPYLDQRLWVDWVGPNGCKRTGGYTRTRIYIA